MADSRERRRRTPGVAVTQDANLLATCGELPGVNRRIVRLCAAAGEERFLQSSGRDLCELFGQIALRLVGVERRSVGQRLDLLDNRRVDFRIRVPDAVGQTPP